MVHSARGESALSDLKPSALAKQQIIDGHSDVGEGHLSVPNGRIVIAQRGQGSQHCHAGGVFGDQNLRLLQVAIGIIGITLAHDDKDFAALIGGAVINHL